MIALKIRFDRLKQMLFVVNKVIDTGTQSTLVNHVKEFNAQVCTYTLKHRDQLHKLASKLRLCRNN